MKNTSRVLFVDQYSGFDAEQEGKFTAKDAKRRGLIRVDREHPFHFIWEGTGEHYFWNGTTTYWLMGWDDETIRRNIDRLHRLRVNRMRVAICGRVKNGRLLHALATKAPPHTR